MSYTEITTTTNEINNFSVSELNYIRESIENMNKFNQVEVLRILNKQEYCSNFYLYFLSLHLDL
jgi:hypothetical protein